MYPVMKPQLGLAEILSVLKPNKNAIKDFEEAFAKKIGAKYAIAFPYARSGLYSALKILGIKNSEIIVPAYTCIVVPNTIVHSGNKPIFVDVSKKDYNLDIKLVKKSLTKKTKAVIPAHLFGYPLNVKKLKKILPKGVIVIEDSCLSLLTKIDGRKNIGAEGEINFFFDEPFSKVEVV